MTQPSHLSHLRCDHCGAPLGARSGSGLVICSYCGSPSNIRPATFVSGCPQGETEASGLKNGAEQLGREEDLQMSPCGSPGNESPGPASQAGAIIIAAAVAAFGIFWTCSAFSAGAPLFFCLFGLVFAAVAMGTVIQSLGRSHLAKKAQRGCRQQQDRLVGLNRPDWP